MGPRKYNELQRSSESHSFKDEEFEVIRNPLCDTKTP